MTTFMSGSGDPTRTIETTVTYLEMDQRPSHPTVPAPMGKFAILRAEQPTVSFYRYLYDTVGEPWNWTDRRVIGGDQLGAIISDPKVEIYVLYASGVPAGFAELDRRVEGEVELAYFGLLPDFTGRGLGRYFLDWAIHAAWESEPRRVWLHTCDLDDPRALPLYQRAGFTAYRRRVETVVALEALEPGRPMTADPPSGGGSG